MNKKKNIQIAIIVIAFGASGIVLYNGFFKSSAPTPILIPAGETPSIAGQPAAAAVSGSQEILPAGDQLLDFSSLIKSQNLSPQNISYPELNPSGDIGIPENSLIIPLAPIVNK